MWAVIDQQQQQPEPTNAIINEKSLFSRTHRHVNEWIICYSDSRRGLQYYISLSSAVLSNTVDREPSRKNKVHRIGCNVLRYSTNKTDTLPSFRYAQWISYCFHSEMANNSRWLSGRFPRQCLHPPVIPCLLFAHNHRCSHAAPRAWQPLTVDVVVAASHSSSQMPSMCSIYCASKMAIISNNNGSRWLE